MSEKFSEQIKTTIYTDTADLRTLHKSKYTAEFKTIIMAQSNLILVNNHFLNNVFAKTLIGTPVYLKKIGTDSLAIKTENTLFEIKRGSTFIYASEASDLDEVTYVFSGKKVRTLLDVTYNSFNIRAGIRNGLPYLLNYSYPYTYSQDITMYDEYIIEDTSYLESRIRNKYVFKDNICFENKNQTWQPTSRFTATNIKNGQYLELDDLVEQMIGVCEFKVINDEVPDFSLSNLTIKLPRKFHNIVNFSLNDLLVPEPLVPINDKDSHFQIELFDTTLMDLFITKKLTTFPNIIKQLTSSDLEVSDNNIISLKSKLPFKIKPSHIASLLELKTDVMNTHHQIKRKTYLYILNENSVNVSSNMVSNIFAKVNIGSSTGGYCEFNPPLKEISQIRFKFVDAYGKDVIFSNEEDFTFNLNITEKVFRLVQS